MSTDMNTLGSALRLNGSITENALFAEAKEQILNSTYFEDQSFYRHAHDGVLSDAENLEGLFSAFNQVLVRDKDGDIVACVGFDDVWIDPAPLFEALAHGLRDGSWYACKLWDDEGTAYVNYILDSVCVTEEHTESDVTYGDCISGLDQEKITTWVRGATHQELLDGVKLPGQRSDEILIAFDKQVAYQAA